MAFDYLLITRPLAEAEELAGQLAELPLKIAIQPAHEFGEVRISTAQIAALTQAKNSKTTPLLVFTSPRAVQFALQQLSQDLLAASQLAAIGPATASVLLAAGLGPVIQSEAGYTSEDLLRRLDEIPLQARQAWIIAAAGGRTALLQGLQQRGLAAEMLLVYERRAALISAQNIHKLEQSGKILSVWTSAESIKLLSAGISASAWQQVCAGEWLVVSERLAEIAAASKPAAVHLSTGPANAELAMAIRKLCLPS